MTAAHFVLETDGGQRLVVDRRQVAPDDERVPLSFRVDALELRPGLINAHDHLALNHFPRLGAPPYANLYRWAEDVTTRFASEVARCRAFPRRDALLFGALKNLLGGVTRVVHHDHWSSELDGDFPVRVERVRVVHSLGLEVDPVAARDAEPALHDRPVCMHLAEGVDEVARGEVREAAQRGLLEPGLLAVHLLGSDGDDAHLLREAGVGFVWCPSSSLHLYQGIAPAELFVAGMDVLLGTDSLLSGEGTLLDELALAGRLGCLSDGRLERAVGATAAGRLGLPPPSLEPGAPADVVALRAPLLSARPRDVALVLVDGAPRYGDAELLPLFQAAGVPAEPLLVGGERKVVAAPLGSVARAATTLAPDCGRIFS